MLRSSDLVLKGLGDFSACFCRGTGQTHLLDAFSATILQTLPSSAPGINEDALLQALALELGVDDYDESLVERVRDILDTLTDLRLVVSHHAAS